jgi:hypothetical protein
LTTRFLFEVSDMSAMQRTKGRAGEQEAAALIRDWLGVDVKRNWQAQSAEGGADLTGLPGWACEIKRAKQPSVRQWWEQTAEQASRCGARPVLLYRIDGQGRGLDPLDTWRAVVRLWDVQPSIRGDYLCEMSLRAWLELAREHLTASTNP